MTENKLKEVVQPLRKGNLFFLLLDYKLHQLQGRNWCNCVIREVKEVREIREISVITVIGVISVITVITVITVIM